MTLVYQGRRACAFKRKNGLRCERDVDLKDGVYCWQHKETESDYITKGHREDGQ